jgi:hypothetical protein
MQQSCVKNRPSLPAPRLKIMGFGPVDPNSFFLLIVLRLQLLYCTAIQ